MKSIECHYKDGSLFFSTTQVYPYTIAAKILGVFNLHGLRGSIKVKSNDAFKVIGQMHVDYDPFESQDNNWPRVLQALQSTKGALEQEVRRI